MLTEEALILRLKSNEHDFVERKPLKQHGEWRNSAVAFANSAPIGWPAVLFVGVNNAGVPQCQTVGDVENLIRSVSDALDNAYPAIYRHVVPLNIPDEGRCVSVVIPGSPTRPHFSGQSYVRVGDQTKSASEAQFAELIAVRSSKVRAIMEWVDKEITWTHLIPHPPYGGVTRAVNSPDTVVVATCNQHYITVRAKPSPGASWTVRSYRLGTLELGFDHIADRLQIYCHDNS